MMSSLLIQKREYLQNEKRYSKKENATPPHPEKPFKPAATILLLHRRFKDSLTFAQEQGQLSSSQKQAMNTLLEKKEKVRRFIKNWRPISLINVDVKIASTAIARRLETILPELIHQNQNGFIKGRSVFDAVRTIDDLLELAQVTHKSGILVAIDFKKAFDCLNHTYL